MGKNSFGSFNGLESGGSEIPNSHYTHSQVENDLE
jgi:hypothetical protein